MDTTVTSRAALKHGPITDPLEFAETYFPQDEWVTDSRLQDVERSYSDHWFEEMSNAPVDAPASAPMLLALNATGKHIYGGTVPAAVIAKRRAAGKAARKARKVNR